jgi:hypothetical protein
MKGQFTWDYVVSIITFITLVSYISLQIIGNIPNMLNAIRNEFLRSEAYQLSELLINDPGQPPNWNSTNVERIGLSNESLNITNYISASKISHLRTICNNNYGNLVKLLGIDVSKYNISITIFDKTNDQLLVNCMPQIVILRAINVTIKRYAAIDNGNYAEIILQAW